MAITIRTGANGSYKSSYVAHFVILEALKAGRVVVTNLEGMQPLDEIERRLDIVFPSTARLIRIFSRDKAGIELWQHFFCWCPIGALIVIDECQDIFSKNIGFRLEKVFHRPLVEFLPFLPRDYESFFYSRYVPVDMSSLDASEIDDRGQAEFDDKGRIIYPFSFNEGFMRHRKYNWDIELLSPDWGQIDSAIRACAEQCFFHKANDGMFWAKRKPIVFKHPKNCTTPVVPRSKDPNVLSVKIPLDAFLLYKSTATGVARHSGAVNVLYKNPKFLAAFGLGIGCIGYFAYGLSSLVFASSAQVEDAPAAQVESVVSQSPQNTIQKNNQGNSVLSNGGDSNTANARPNNQIPAVPNRLELVRNMLDMYDIQNIYFMGHVITKKNNINYLSVALEAITPSGETYYINDGFLRSLGVKFAPLDDCLLSLIKGNVTVNITCKPIQREQINQSSPEPIQLASLF